MIYYAAAQEYIHSEKKYIFGLENKRLIKQENVSLFGAFIYFTRIFFGPCLARLILLYVFKKTLKNPKNDSFIENCLERIKNKEFFQFRL